MNPHAADGNGGSTPGPSVVQRVVVADDGIAVVAGNGDAAANIQKITYQVPGALGPLPSVEPPLRARPARLRGRDALVEELTAALTAPDGSYWVLHGIGGGGKTAIALTVAAIAEERRMPVFWIRGGTGVPDAMLSVAERCDVPRDQVNRARLNLADAAFLTWEALNARHDPWLLVFDNADDPLTLGRDGEPPATGTGWARGSRSGTVLITSRNGDENLWGTAVLARRRRVRSLDGDDAAQVLLDLAPDAATSANPAAEAALVADRLAGLPLALRLAGRYLANEGRIHRTFHAYRRALDADLPDLIDRPVIGGHLDDERARECVRTTWELSLKLLDAQGLAPARPLLQTLACLGAPHPLRREFLTPSLLSGSVVDLGPEPLTPGYVEQIVTGMAAVALIDHHDVPIDTRRTDTEAILCLGIHPLLSEVMLRTVERSARGEAIWTLAVQLLLGVSPDDAVAPEKATGWATLPAVYAYVLDHLPPRSPEDLGGAALGAAMCVDHLRSAGRFAEAARLARQTEERSRELPSAHPSRVSARLAVVRATGDSETRPAVAELRSLLGELEHRRNAELEPAIMEIRHLLAAALLDLGETDAAESEYTWLAAREEETLGSPSCLTRYGRAQVDRARGRLEAAESALREVLAEESGTLGPEHPGTLTTRAVLAHVLAERGDDRAARSEAAAVLRLQESRYGPDNPVTILARMALLQALANLGDLAEAEGQLRHVLRIQRDSLEPDHPMALASLAVLTNFRGLVNEDDDPKVSEDRVRAISVALAMSHGDEHPFTLLTRFQATIYRYRYDELGALTECSDVLRAMTSLNGLDHPLVLNVRLFRALMLADQGDLRAEAELRELHDAQRRVLLPHHSLALLTQTCLAGLCFENGEADAAEALMRRVLRVHDDCDGPDDERTMRARTGLVNLLAQRGDFAAAEHEMQVLIGSLERTEGGQSLETQGARTMLAAIHVERGEFDQAERTFRKILEVLGTMPPQESRGATLVIRSLLGDVLRHRGRLDAAHAELSQALKGLEDDWGRDDEDALDVRVSLGELQHERGELREAERLLGPAVERLNVSLGPADPAAVRARLSLETVQELLTGPPPAIEPGSATRRDDAPADPPGRVVPAGADPGAQPQRPAETAPRPDAVTAWQLLLEDRSAEATAAFGALTAATVRTVPDEDRWSTLYGLSVSLAASCDREAAVQTCHELVELSRHLPGAEDPRRERATQLLDRLTSS